MEGSVRPRLPPAAAFLSRKHGNRLFSLLPPTIACTHDGVMYPGSIGTRLFPKVNADDGITRISGAKRIDNRIAPAGHANRIGAAVSLVIYWVPIASVARLLPDKPVPVPSGECDIGHVPNASALQAGWLCDGTACRRAARSLGGLQSRPFWARSLFRALLSRCYHSSESG